MKRAASPITAVVILAWASAACAHPPSGIDGKIGGGKADITVRHGVADPAAHYIKRITLSANGATVAERAFTSQTDGTKQAASFDVPSVRKGDTITVSAECNRAGTAKKDVKAH